MMRFRLPRPVSISLAMATWVWLWPAVARADIITVDWDVVPHQQQELAFDSSPFYQCSGAVYTSRLCQSLWQGGLELGTTLFSFYDDKWFDGFGLDGALALISPRCEAGLAPCFDTFTPISMQLSGFTDLDDPPNLFVASSRGGLVQIPASTGLNVINFGGPEWEDITSLEIGFYLPPICETGTPDEIDAAGVNCSLFQEKALVPESLTFQAVPEPMLSLLCATGIGLAVRRGRRARALSRGAEHSHCIGR